MTAPSPPTAHAPTHKNHTNQQADFDASPRWTARELFFWRLLARRLLAAFPSDADCAAAFARLADQSANGGLARGLGLFFKTRVGPWLAAEADAAGAGPEAAQADALLRRLRSAERALARGKGAVLAV